MDLQELISRGRFAFSGASERLATYKLVDGKRTAKDLANLTKRHVNNIHRDLRRLTNLDLLREREKGGEIVTKDGFILYERHLWPEAFPIRTSTVPFA